MTSRILNAPVTTHVYLQCFQNLERRLFDTQSSIFLLDNDPRLPRILNASQLRPMFGYNVSRITDVEPLTPNIA